MGCYSVPCGVSDITITSGLKAIILPLHKHYEWRPATLPIFGKYNDYGNLENIVMDQSVEIIQGFYKKPINEFLSSLKEGDEPSLSHLSYMWILQDVYDFMRNHHPEERQGHIYLGDKTVLESIGFKHSHTDETRERYKEVFKTEDYMIYSDGTWLEGYCYNTKKFKELYPKVDISKIEKLEEHQTFALSNENSIKALEIFDEYAGIEIETNKLRIKYQSSSPIHKFNVPIENYYDQLLEGNKEILNPMLDLWTIFKNMRYYSRSFLPYRVDAPTPQFGEQKEHRIILDGFRKIVKKLEKIEQSDQEI